VRLGHVGKLKTRTSLGFTLIELMIGLAVGLVSTLAITQILLSSEGQKRTTTAGSDAQVSAVLAMDTLRNSIQVAGYGFASLPKSIGCPVETKFKGSAVAGFAANLVPVIITDGASGAPDSIRVISSSKNSFSLPLQITDPGYVAGDATLGTAFPVAASTGSAANDLMVAVNDAATKCQVFQTTSVATSAINRSDDAGWNNAGFPSLAYNAVSNSALINMGQFNDVTYTVSDAGTLQFNRLTLAADFTPSYTGNVSLYSNIVNMQAYYGKASTINGTTILNAPIDTWDATTPSNNTLWLQVLALKVAVVSRSDQYEKTEVTTTDPLWDVGAGSTIAGAADCGTSKCIVLKIPRPANSTDWMHYRYKVFDSVIPLRNMLWSQ
jgi:type IV pilus assembly protein PilW